MSESRFFSLKKTSVIVIAVGLVAFVVYLYFIGWANIADTILRADPFFYSSALAALFLSVLFYALTWQRLLNLMQVKSSFLKAFQFVWVGSFIDILIPAESVSGDISKVYLMTNESGENAGKVVASVVGHRMLTMTVTLGGLIVGSVYFVANYHVPMLAVGFITLIAVGTLVSIVLIFLLSKKRRVTDRAVTWLIGLLVRLSRGRWKFEGLKNQAEKMLASFHQGIDSLSVRPKLLALPVFLAIVSWFFDLSIAVFVFKALGSAVPLSAILIVYSIGTAVQTIPIGIPGEVGVLDLVMSTLYTLLTIPIVISAAATVLIRFLTLWVRLLVGGLTAQWLGIKAWRTPNSPNPIPSSLPSPATGEEKPQ